MPSVRGRASSRPSFKAAVQDIQEAQQHLNRANSSMEGLTDDERRAKVLGLFNNASLWRTGTGMGLMKEPVTADSQPGPGTHIIMFSVELASCPCLFTAA